VSQYKELKLEDDKVFFRTNPSDAWTEMTMAQLWELYRDATRAAIEYKLAYEETNRRLKSRTL
jgi:hypothetical protein